VRGNLDGWVVVRVVREMGGAGGREREGDAERGRGERSGGLSRKWCYGIKGEGVRGKRGEGGGFREDVREGGYEEGGEGLQVGRK